MKLSRLLVSLGLLLVTAAAAAAQWKPAAAPLMTKWGKQVTPDNVWKEYPRPQLVRKDWLNLNGLWDYRIESRLPDPVPPFPSGQILVPYPIESALSGVGRRVTKDERIVY